MPPATQLTFNRRFPDQPCSTTCHAGGHKGVQAWLPFQSVLSGNRPVARPACWPLPRTPQHFLLASLPSPRPSSSRWQGLGIGKTGTSAGPAPSRGSPDRGRGRAAAQTNSVERGNKGPFYWAGWCACHPPRLVGSQGPGCGCAYDTPRRWPACGPDVGRKVAKAELVAGPVPPIRGLCWGCVITGTYPVLSGTYHIKPRSW